MSVNGTFVENKMRRFKGECVHFRFNKCPIYIHDGANAKFSINSHETDNSADKELVAVEPFSFWFSLLACWFGRFTVSSLLLSQWRCNETGVVDPDSFQVYPDPNMAFLEDVQSKL